MDYRTRLTIEPGKRGGKPCIRGMRMTVGDVLTYLAAGTTAEEILADFPYLDADDIRACLSYAADREQQTHDSPDEDPTLALFAQWDREDALMTPEERARMTAFTLRSRKTTLPEFNSKRWRAPWIQSANGFAVNDGIRWIFRLASIETSLASALLSARFALQWAGLGILSSGSVSGKEMGAGKTSIAGCAGSLQLLNIPAVTEQRPLPRARPTSVKDRWCSVSQMLSRFTDTTSFLDLRKRTLLMHLPSGASSS